MPARNERGYNLMTENLVDCKWVDHDVGIIIKAIAVTCSKAQASDFHRNVAPLKNSRWC